MPETKNVTATILRRQLRPALKTVESGGRVVITRHNKVVAALVSAADFARLSGVSAEVPDSAIIVVPAAPPASVRVLGATELKEAFTPSVTASSTPTKLLTDL